MPRKVVTAFLRTSTARPVQTLSTAIRCNAPVSRAFHTSMLKAAIAHPVTAHGPPPNAPSPAAGFGDRRKQQTEGEGDRQQGQPQPRQIKRPMVLKKRFWKDVDVQRKQEGDYQVLLDTRPVRTPAKDELSIPSTKPYLAHAIALEWDVLNSARQALKNHMIPLTSLAARAGDIAQEDFAGTTIVRDQIVETAMRYLDTDTLICWVPEQTDYTPEVDENGQKRETLREAQIRVAKDIIAFLSTKVWPGIEIVPVLDTNSIFPASQTQATKDIIQQWIQGLEAHDLAALERGILASKSLLVAARLVADWSENFRHLQRPGQQKFGIDEAAEASSLEVRWQTDMWGEVEDTHDVDKEDLKRQLGSVIVLVSGETR
ncbi:hypothetical protein BDW59DRAFT_146973 [Aspergillus cavernicola]|uniref:ATP12-domain-containing protein n=1 Tax=Aspergillus cavernicola TaxID=176166 RepID=A0ABR4IAE5_9EURO